MTKSEKSVNISGNEKQTVDKIPQPTGKKSKKTKNTPHELMHEHLADQKHVITEEDLKNLDLKTPDLENPSNVPLEIEDSDNRPHDEDKDHRIKTPWDVLDE